MQFTRIPDKSLVYGRTQKSQPEKGLSQTWDQTSLSTEPFRKKGKERTQTCCNRLQNRV